MLPVRLRLLGTESLVPREGTFALLWGAHDRRGALGGWCRRALWGGAARPHMRFLSGRRP
jgi:hypothetical protein